MRMQTALRQTSKFCEMGMFDNWAGGGNGGAPKEKPVAAPPASSNNGGTAPPGNANGGGDNTSNNTPNNDQIVEEIWKAQEKKNEPAPQNPQQPNNPGLSEDDEVAQHLAKQGLGPLKLTDVELEAFKSGEGVQQVLDNINARMQNGYLKAVSAANMLITKQVKAAVDEAVGQSRNLMANDKARTALFKALPWASDAAIAPVAESVMRQFMAKNGNDVDGAVELTKRYYLRVQQKMDPDYTPNTNTNGNFRRTPQAPAGDTDWIHALRG